MLEQFKSWYVFSLFFLSPMDAAKLGLGSLESRICLLFNLARLYPASRCIFCSSVYKI